MRSNVRQIAKFYPIIQKILQSYAVLSATTPRILSLQLLQIINFLITYLLPDLNPLDYHVCGAMLQAFHKIHPKPNTIPELKSVLQQIWDGLPQTTINDFRERLNACVAAMADILNIRCEVCADERVAIADELSN